MPDHIRLILRHAAIGFLLAVVFVAGLLVFNIGNLWHLVTASPDGWLALLMLVVFFTITFGSAQIGIRIMLDADDDDDDDYRGGRRDPLADGDLIPIRLRSHTGSARHMLPRG